MVLTKEELEIREMYKDGACPKELAEVYGYRIYWIKKLLSDQPKFAALGYIFRNLPSNI